MMNNPYAAELDNILFDMKILEFTQDKIVLDKMKRKEKLNNDDLLKIDILITSIIDYYFPVAKNTPTNGIQQFMFYIINRCHEIKKFIINYKLKNDLAYNVLLPRYIEVPPMSICSRIGNQYLEHELNNWIRKQSILTRILTILREFITTKYPNICPSTLIYYSNEVSLSHVEMIENN